MLERSVYRQKEVILGVLRDELLETESIAA